MIPPARAPDPPAEPAPERPPGGLVLYRIYRGALLAFYAGFVALGLWAALGPAPPGQAGGAAMGLTIALVGGVCATLVVASFFLPRRPWAWNAHLVLVALGVVGVVTSPCALLMALIWFRRDILAWFGHPAGREPPGAGPPGQA